jgi:tetratricopeptide (TPR) repeat protein
MASTAVLFAALTAASCAPPGPRASISEEMRILDTYPFSDPNPVPVLATDRRLYPYHTFEGYAAEPEPREWKVVRMENDLIEVFVLPEVGGKVWGAVVKATGHEFIYRNEVMKFRDIALRGPWTSGGIEFNFGVIGHTPATATPVDYDLRENADGSVSAIVGAMDLPSRTPWRVEIRLPADRAAFETRVLWHNPTPLEQPYYNWMTAAAFAQDDLELFVPGTAYLEHSGRVRPWPADEDARFLPLYRNNAFGGSKSYHVVGALNDFFGGYYHDDGYGWGHWAPHEEMPGRKMWLWALSREGGIWEDLLTDTDGQYVEFQAGRLHVQYQPGADRNPISQAGFEPLSASRWTEVWFPLEGTGGLTDASPLGAMHVEAEEGHLRVVVQAFGAAADTVKAWSGDEQVAARAVALEPLQPVVVEFDVAPDGPWRVSLPGLGLEGCSNPGEAGLGGICGLDGDRAVSRPFATNAGAWDALSETDRLVFEARELARGRRYPEARALYDRALATEPWNREALLGLGSLALRSARYEEGLVHARRALQLDTYDAEANFLAGNLYLALGRRADALDSFGWAARSVAFRAAARVRLAELALDGGDLAEARRHAALALEHDQAGIPAREVLAIASRLAGDGIGAARVLAELLEVDPLSHFFLAERYLAARDDRYGESADGAAARLAASMRSEYPEQTLLELAVGYANRGLPGDAAHLLELADEVDGGPVATAWRAFLADDAGMLGAAADPDFAFPYRPETLPVLRWAAREDPHWGWRYLLGLNLWALDRDAEAADVFATLGDEPDYGPAYAARAHLTEIMGGDPGPDFRRAATVDSGNRLLHVALVRHLQEAGQWAEAIEASGRGRELFPGDFNLDLLHVRSLLQAGDHGEAIRILADTRVLPSENARESHRLYEFAHVGAALDELDDGNRMAARSHLETALEWPESLGQGRPFDPDERLVRFLLEVVAEGAGGGPDAEAADAEAVASLRARADSLAGEASPTEVIEQALIRRALAAAAGLGGR